MPVEVTLMTPADIDGAIVTIQEAFKDDPYSNWVFDKSQVCSIVSHCFSTISIHPRFSPGTLGVLREKASLR